MADVASGMMGMQMGMMMANQMTGNLQNNMNGQMNQQAAPTGNGTAPKFRLFHWNLQVHLPSSPAGTGPYHQASYTQQPDLHVLIYSQDM